MKNSMFDIKENEKGQLTFLGNKKDPYKMNWVEGNKNWGTIICSKGINVTCSRQFTLSGNLEECYRFENVSEFPIFLNKKDIGIYIPFNDDYESSAICMKQRCHTHIFCGGEASYVMALRMGGEGPHLGLQMTKGGISGYSIERREETEEKDEVVSNDRGDFIFHPQIYKLQPGETAEIRWELFWYDRQEEFENKLITEGKIPVIRTRQCTYFKGEKIEFQVLYGKKVKDTSIEIFCNKEKTEYSYQHREGLTSITCIFTPQNIGVHRFDIYIEDIKMRAAFYVCPDLYDLIENRCRFIAEKQQYHGSGESLDGAYLIYDNDENQIYYDHILHDHNAGRERVGMGVLIALWLQKKKDEFLEKSLNQYIKFVYRELYDRDTGTVYNDISHNLEWHRLYNYPWMAVFQLELYHLLRDEEYLKDACRTMMRYYLNGGDFFYAIGIPMKELISEMENAGMFQQSEELKAMFFKQADYIKKNSTIYPPSEVNYEQSIVAPAVSCLVQAFGLSKNEAYLKEAEEQLEILKLFNGRQPDYHQFENAVRHWDGYWFGKYKMLGDTYPHYWSVLTGVAYIQYAEETGMKKYNESAKASLRGCLNLFSEEGRASCAMVFPEYVNGEKAHFYDKWANDQDWALYYALKYETTIR